jgi:exopolyphosphatase/guanosine-5'-triphosphate,3'-diphosphate pyrophosphatase
LRVCDRAATLTLPAAYADLASERVLNRLKALGKLMGADAQIEVAP